MIGAVRLGLPIPREMDLSGCGGVGGGSSGVAKDKDSEVDGCT